LKGLKIAHKLGKKPAKAKAPPKPTKPAKPKPLRGKPKKPHGGKPRKPKKPKAPPKPPKTWIGQLFGKNRREKIRPITEEDRARIKDAEAAIKEAQRHERRKLKPDDISPLGYEYYQLIAAMEKMSSHDVYTLFMSP
jgi:hypothetical protein